MKESTLEKSLMNVNSVASVLVKKGVSANMKESILERGVTNVNSVGSV